MKKHRFIREILIIVLTISLFNSCEKTEYDKKGFVTFGANYHVINCISTVTVYIDNVKVGLLNNPTNSILNCGEKTNITKELSIGEHTYKIEIRPVNDTGCTKDIFGSIMISENDCEKIFIDYLQLF